MITLRPGSQTWRLLHILVATTEYPARSLHLLGSGRYYEALIHRLETPQEFRSADGTVLGRFKVLNVSGRHEKRTIRLNKAALPLLTHLHPDALDYYMAASGGHRFSGNSDHILRNHRVAESLVLCMASGAMALSYQLPPLQKSIIQHTVPTSPSFYIAREVKKLEKTELSKTIFTRLTGALFSHGICFAVYNTRDSVMKWSGMGEFKTANHLTEVARMNAGVDRVDRALLLGQGNNVALTTLLSSANSRRMDLRFDRIYPHTGVYLVVKQDEQSKSELLETLSLANDYNIHIEGWSRRASVEHGGLNKTPYEPVEVHISMYEASGLPYPPKGTKTALGVYINDRLVKEVPISLSNQKESYQEWRLTGEFDIPMQDVSTQTGDVVTFVALVADNYGRKASSVLSRYKILEGKELEYLAYDMLDLTGQTYGTEVWQ